MAGFSWGDSRPPGPAPAVMFGEGNEPSKVAKPGGSDKVLLFGWDEKHGVTLAGG